MRVSLSALLSIVSFYSLSQDLVGKDTISFEAQITTICGNLKNELYVGLDNGEIVKSDIDGKVQEVFSYPNLGTISKINCANPLKVFVFFEDTQQYIFLDRFSVRPSVYTTANNLYERIDFLELAADQSLWSIWSPGLEMKQQVGKITNELYLLQSILDVDENILGLHAVGNQMILQSEKKLYFFNLAGQLINSTNGTPSEIGVSQNKGFFLLENEGLVVSSDRNLQLAIPKGFELSIVLDSALLLSKKSNLYFYSIR